MKYNCWSDPSPCIKLERLFLPHTHPAQEPTLQYESEDVAMSSRQGHKNDPHLNLQDFSLFVNPREGWEVTGVLCVCTLNICLIVWRGTASLAKAAAESDAMKLELRHGFLWAPLLGMLLALGSGNKGNEMFPLQEGTLSSPAGERTGNGLTHSSHVQTSPLAVLPQPISWVIYIFLL